MLQAFRGPPKTSEATSESLKLKHFMREQCASLWLILSPLLQVILYEFLYIHCTCIYVTCMCAALKVTHGWVLVSYNYTFLWGSVYVCLYWCVRICMVCTHLYVHVWCVLVVHMYVSMYKCLCMSVYVCTWISLYCVVCISGTYVCVYV